MLQVPVVIVAITNQLFGLDPAVLLRDGIDARLAAVQAWAQGEPGAAEGLEALARRGSPELVKLAELVQNEHRAEETLARDMAVIRAVIRLMLCCRAIDMLKPGALPAWAGPIARDCAACRGRAHSGRVSRRCDRRRGDADAAHDTRATRPPRGCRAGEESRLLNGRCLHAGAVRIRAQGYDREDDLLHAEQCAGLARHRHQHRHLLLRGARQPRRERAQLADALLALASILRLSDGVPDRLAMGREERRFADVVTAAQLLLQDDPYEAAAPDGGKVDEGLASRVQELVLPVAMLADTAEPDAGRVVLADWLSDAAARLRAMPAASVGLLSPPALPAGPAHPARMLLACLQRSAGEPA
jgi:hypothetical protein